MKLNGNLLLEAISEGSSYSEEDSVFIKLIWNSGWIGGHKGEDQDYVVEYQSKFYQVSDHRSGSDFSEWNYDSRDYWRNKMVDCDEVEKVEVITYKWIKKR